MGDKERWRKSSRTQGANNCVEMLHTRAALRDSKDESKRLEVPSGAFEALLSWAKRG
jgi:hypothetical protein